MSPKYMYAPHLPPSANTAPKYMHIKKNCPPNLYTSPPCKSIPPCASTSPTPPPQETQPLVQYFQSQYFQSQYYTCRTRGKRTGLTFEKFQNSHMSALWAILNRKSSSELTFEILQHTATRCNTLQHTATHCNTNQRSEFTFGQFYLSKPRASPGENFQVLKSQRYSHIL